MAINYLNTVDLNKNQLNNAAIQNLGTDPATGVLGQVYYNTTDSILKICVTASTTTPTNAVWAEVGGGVETLTTTDGTYIDLTPNTPVAGAVTVTADLSAADGTPSIGKRFLTKDNTWAVPIISDQNTTYTLPVSAGTAVAGHSVADIDLTAGGSGSGIASKVTFAGKNSNIAITETTLNNGIVNIALTTDVVIDDNLTLGGEISQTGTGLENIFASELNMSSQKITNVLDPTNPQDAATKQYVDDATLGGLIYQGAYNASTNAPNLDTVTNIAIKQGFTYTVTVAGDFFTEAVGTGDVIIANVDIPANSATNTLANWTTVQNNVDLASLTTVGIGNVVAGGAIDVSYSSGTATVSVEDSTAANKGAVIVAGADPITVTYNSGTAEVGIENASPTNKGAISVLGGTGISVNYSTGTATVANTDTNATNTKTGSIPVGDLFGTVTHTFGQNTLVQTFDAGSGATVFCDVVRGTTTPYTVTATISATQTTAITILVQKIG
jgi:hypothetical protein